MTFTYSIFGLDGWNEDKTLPPGWMLDQVSNKYIPSGWIFSSFTVKSQASRSNHANAVSLSQCHGYTLTDIWLKMMRMHIDLKICHFLLFTLSIAEAGKSKNKGETGIHGPSLCRGSTTKQFLFHRVLKKMAKI